MKQRINLLNEDEKLRQSQIVTNKLLQMQSYKTSQRVSVFLSMRSEIQTQDIIKNIFHQRKDLFIPRYTTVGGNKMDMVRLNTWEEYEELPVTKWNIKQPSLDAPNQSADDAGGLDLIIVPGVAFTKDGHRMGHGGGFYDAYIKRCTTKFAHRPYLIGMAFKEQIVDSVPITEHDEQIDVVLYESRDLSAC